jgi:hypothetical protein
MSLLRVSLKISHGLDWSAMLMHVLVRISRVGRVAGVVSVAIAALPTAHANELHAPPHAGSSLTVLVEDTRRLAESEGVRIEKADVMNLLAARPQLRASIEDVFSQGDPTLRRDAAVLLVELITTSTVADRAR